MFYGLNKFIKNILPKRLFYRGLLIVAVPIVVLQVTISLVFFDSLWIKTNSGMTRALVSEVKTFIDAYDNDETNKDFIIVLFKNHLGINIKYEKDKILPDKTPERWFSPVDRSLRRELKSKNLNYWFNTRNYKEVIDLKIGYTKGYFQFYIPRDRLTSSSARLFGLWITLPAFLMVAVAIIFLKNQTRPIIRLAEASEKFGKGELEGIAAPEAANNAVNGPTLVPLLTLGIPGDNVTAILLGAFVAHGLRPGPELMSEQGSIVFAILLCMLLANVLFLILGYFTMPIFSKVVTIKKSYLIPLTIIFAFAGSFVFRHNPADLYFLLFFGIFGYVLKKLEFDVTPLVMAFILAPSLEYAFGQTLSLGDDNVIMFLLSERPIAALIIVSTPVITWKLWKRSKKLRNVATTITSEQVK